MGLGFWAVLQEKGVSFWGCNGEVGSSRMFMCLSGSDFGDEGLVIDWNILVLHCFL